MVVFQQDKDTLVSNIHSFSIHALDIILGQTSSTFVEETFQRALEMKHCALCHIEVHKGDGLYYGGYLIHRKCLPIAKIQHYRLSDQAKRAEAASSSEKVKRKFNSEIRDKLGF